MQIKDRVFIVAGASSGIEDSILAHAAKAIEIEDIEARVSELERAAEVKKNSRH